MVPPFQPVPEEGATPYLIAHRGVPVKAPENTIASFALALQCPGIDMVELDVRLSSDDEAVVLHDRTLQRTTTGNGSIRKYSTEELRRFDAGSWFDPAFSSERIPTLHEVLTLTAKRRWVNIELKGSRFFPDPEGLLERRVLETVYACGMERHVMYSSFIHRLVANIRLLDAKATTGVIYNVYTDFGRTPTRLAEQSDASVFVCAKHELRRSMIADARKKNIAIYIYTLNTTNDVQRILDQGVHGIISDNADDLVEIIKHT